MKDDSKLFAFVLMPFSRNFDDVYRLGIKETTSKLGIEAERVDEQFYHEGILDRIYRQIELADIVIADMSSQNPNVFYEVGYAHAKEKLCVHITKDVADIPFDLKHHRHIVYGDSIQVLRKNLYEELKWAKTEITNIRSSKIKIDLKQPFGLLEKTKYSAVGKVDFIVDLLNETKKSSADIEAVYFYCGKGWKLFQDGKECPSTKSDLLGFHARHFLTSPLRKFHRDSWAQLKFRSEKILARSYLGDEIKDSYLLAGRAVIRLVTSEGHYDYEIPINIEIDAVPF